MDLKQLEFVYLDGLQIQFWPACPKENDAFRAVSLIHLKPLSLASMLGQLSEEKAVDALMRCYAQAVIHQSPTPGYGDYKPDDWYRWLREHPDEFETLRSYAEPDNLEELADQVPSMDDVC